MTLRTIQQLLTIAYLSAPIIAIALALFDRRRRIGDPSGRRRSVHIGGVAFTFSASIVLGCAVSLGYAVAVGGHIALGQIALTVYLVAALMFVLRFFDAMLVIAMKQFWIRVLARFAPREKPRRRFALALIPGFTRAAVLIIVGLPYLLGAALVYRPRIVPSADPTSLKLRFEDARIQTSDGLMLAAWFLPGEDEALREGQYQTSSPTNQERTRRSTQQEQAALTVRTDRTIVLCHGFASGKAGVMRLARPLVRAGYNVLAIDFRAHGESEGQLFSLGANEKLDVLAAVRWLQENHPRQARKIYGLGVSSGAAALLAAAADESPEGQSIAAVAVYESYDSPLKLAHEFARDRFIPPLSWFADRIALASASAHVGADLLHFSPETSAAELWPRPLLVIHGGLDAVVPFERGDAVYEAASEPKRRLWLSLDDYAAAIKSREAIANVVVFFNEARAVPAI